MPRIDSSSRATAVSLIGQSRRAQKRQFPLPDDPFEVARYCREVDPSNQLSIVERLQRASYLWRAGCALREADGSSNDAA